MDRFALRKKIKARITELGNDIQLNTVTLSKLLTGTENSQFGWVGEVYRKNECYAKRVRTAIMKYCHVME
jgi:hypothetical protein